MKKNTSNGSPCRIPVLLFLGALFLSLPIRAASVSGHTIIIVMDGARYTETWGCASRSNIPMIAALATNGVVLSNFRTAAAGSAAEDWSETCPGHARIMTGTYQNIANNGKELPSSPGMFQQFRKQTKKPASSCWLIASKDKLHILGNCSAKGWKDRFLPSMLCGKNGDGTGGYCEDGVTHAAVLQKLIQDRPALMLVNYKDPDSMGHAKNWDGYLKAIREVDGYVADIWNAVRLDPVLKDDTTLIIVNDHGRHTTDYTSHGDTCEGCTHIMCVILGRGVKHGQGSGLTREQIDLAPTIAGIMGFAMPTASGRVMDELMVK